MSHSRPCILTPLTTIVLLLVSISTSADTAYYHHIFFENSLTPDAYFYSSGKVSEPSTLALANGKIPIDTKFSYTPQTRSISNGNPRKPVAGTLAST